MKYKLDRIFALLPKGIEKNVSVVIDRKPIQIINVIMNNSDIYKLVKKLSEKYYLILSANDDLDGLVIGIKNNRKLKILK